MVSNRVVDGVIIATGAAALVYLGYWALAAAFVVVAVSWTRNAVRLIVAVLLMSVLRSVTVFCARRGGEVTGEPGGLLDENAAWRVWARA